jgi:hypothetical protein
MTFSNRLDSFIALGFWPEWKNIDNRRAYSFFKRTQPDVSIEEIQKKANEVYHLCCENEALFHYYQDMAQRERDHARDVGDEFSKEEFDSLTYLMSLQALPPI